MIVEANRIVADWLSDANAVSGVNALLLTVPLDGADPRPAPLALVADETRDGNVARGELPSTLPAIAVTVDSVDNLDGQVAQVEADGHVKMRIRVGVDNPTTEQALRDLSYYLRAVQRSLRLLTSGDAASAAACTRNGIYLESVLDMRVAIIWTATQQGTPTVAGYVLPTLQLRDLLPTRN